MTTTPSDGALDLGPIEPGALQAWNDTWQREYLGQFAAASAASDTLERQFEDKVREGERRYNMEPEFRLKVNLLGKILFSSRSRAVYDSIRAVVALEEMEPGGVLDMHSPWREQAADESDLDRAVRRFYWLDRRESNALQRAHDLGNERSEAAAHARSLGWRG